MDQVIIGVIEFENLDGVRRLVCITTVGRFVHDFETGGWDDITGDSPWDGDADDWLDWIVGEDESGKFLFITNGKNPPQRWDGGAGPFEDLPTDIASFVTCRTFEILASRLVLGNVTTTTHSAQSMSGVSQETLRTSRLRAPVKPFWRMPKVISGSSSNLATGL